MNEAYGVDCRNGCLLPERTPTLQAVCGKSLNGGGYDHETLSGA